MRTTSFSRLLRFGVGRRASAAPSSARGWGVPVLDAPTESTARGVLGRWRPLTAGAFDGLQPDGESKLMDVIAKVLIAVTIGEVLHQVGKSVGDRVQLVLDCLITSGLTVL